MSHHLVARISALVIPGCLLLGACSADRLTGASGRATPPPHARADMVPLSGTVALWNQTRFDQAFVFFLGGLPQPTAADFTVPRGETWTVTRVDLPDIQAPGVVRAQTIGIYTNDGGIPGSSVFSVSLTASEVNQTTFTEFGTGVSHDLADVYYDLPTPLTLNPGTYWLVVPDSRYSLTLATTYDDPALVQDPDGSWSNPLLIEDVMFGLAGTKRTAVDATSGLQTTVDGLGLPTGTQTSLDAKLSAALAALASGDTAAGCSALADFINEVRAQDGKKLTHAQAQSLLAQAAQIRATLGC